MIEFRPFRNTDPPHLVNIWRAQPSLRANAESINRDVLDKYVFAKPYFDRQGLIVAVDDKVPVGFVHAGFCPDEFQRDIDIQTGVLCQLKVLPQANQMDLATELLTQAMDYLRNKGTLSCYAGSRFPHAPFYMGLYGGSRIPGVLQGDDVFLQALQQSGFVLTNEFLVLSRELQDFRPVIDRNLRNIKRNFQIAPHVDPRSRTWWECCSLGMADRDCFSLVDRRNNEIVGKVTYWDMLPLAGEWGVHARGIYDMRIDPEHHGENLELFLLSESLRQLQEQGIGLVEAQTNSGNESAITIFEKLGFVNIDRGFQYAKEIKPA